MTCTYTETEHTEAAVEFLMFARGMGWTNDHTLALVKHEEQSEDWETEHYFTKEQHCSRKRGYLHASEQTPKKITEWMKKLEVNDVEIR